MIIGIMFLFVGMFFLFTGLRSYFFNKRVNKKGFIAATITNKKVLEVNNRKKEKFVTYELEYKNKSGKNKSKKLNVIRIDIQLINRLKFILKIIKFILKTMLCLLHLDFLYV